MPPNDPIKDPQGAAGGLPQGSAGAAGAQADTKPNGEPGNKPPAGKPDGAEPKAQQYITPEILQGVHGAYKREVDEKLSKLQESFRGDMQGAIAAAIKELKAASIQVPDDAEKHKRQADPAELIDLRRTAETQKTEIEKMRAEVESSRARERSFRFETIVKEALNRHGCRRTDRVFKAIQDDLRFDEKTGKVYTMVEGQFGLEELACDDFVKRVVRDELFPELFAPVSKPGSPAAGDQGGGGQRFMFTKEQLDDSNFYAANAEKIREALDKGLVRGIERGGKKT